MTSTFSKRSKQGLSLFISITILIPVVIMAYESIILGKQSVVFLADYPSIVGSIIIIYYVLLVIAGTIWSVYYIKSLLSLRNEKTKNELMHLQSQVNPHFFFNMLNNIYGTIDSDPTNTKSMVLKLSDLMRYSIYEGEKRHVTIAAEIAYLKNYIALHQMRYHKEIDVQWDEKVQDDSVLLPPLLFIVLIENAFKHGVEKMREKAFIHIKIISTANKLEFTVENNFDPADNLETGGFGLNNLERRLALLYPNQHKLQITESLSNYKVYLSIKL